MVILWPDASILPLLERVEALELSSDHEAARAAVEQQLRLGNLGSESEALLHIELLRLLRAHEGVDAARKAFVAMRKAPACSPLVHVASALQEQRRNGESQVARNILQMALKKFPGDLRLTCEFALFLLALNEAGAARALLLSALQHCATAPAGAPQPVPSAGAARTAALVAQLWQCLVECERRADNFEALREVQQDRAEWLARCPPAEAASLVSVPQQAPPQPPASDSEALRLWQLAERHAFFGFGPWALLPAPLAAPPAPAAPPRGTPPLPSRVKDEPADAAQALGLEVGTVAPAGPDARALEGEARAGGALALVPAPAPPLPAEIGARADWRGGEEGAVGGMLRADEKPETTRGPQQEGAPPGAAMNGTHPGDGATAGTAPATFEFAEGVEQLASNNGISVTSPLLAGVPRSLAHLFTQLSPAKPPGPYPSPSFVVELLLSLDLQQAEARLAVQGAAGLPQQPGDDGEGRLSSGPNPPDLSHSDVFRLRQRVKASIVGSGHASERSASQASGGSRSDPRSGNSS